MALAAIGVYQRYLSPYKGFCCAYRVHTGQASCSALGARVIRRFGVWPGLQLLKQRMRRCIRHRSLDEAGHAVRLFDLELHAIPTDVDDVVVCLIGGRSEAAVVDKRDGGEPELAVGV